MMMLLWSGGCASRFVDSQQTPREGFGFPSFVRRLKIFSLTCSEEICWTHSHELACLSKKLAAGVQVIDS